MTNIPGWSGSFPFIADQALEAIEMLVNEQGLPPPDQWTAYDIFMDGENDMTRAMITTEDGGEYEIEQHEIDWDNWTSVDDYDWVWEIWDWIVDNYPEVDVDSHYE